MWVAAVDGLAEDRLDVIVDLARDAGLSRVEEAVHHASDRLRDRLFYVVCIGQFKRGKSTLLNALVGAPILPTGVVPITSAVTIVRHGERLTARVRFRERDCEECDPAALGTYVSEEHNPGNAKDVTVVEVFVPSTLLASGLCLVDTPGLGSVITANTEATRDFLPHVDAALVVLGADPPISGDELDLVRAIAASVHDFIIVFNKADRQPDTERAEALRFTESVVKPVLGVVEPILQISATERLASHGPVRDWPELVGRLTRLARESGAELVNAARGRETSRLIERLVSELEEQRVALTRPLGESERYIAALRAAVLAAERALGDVQPILHAEQERLSQHFTLEQDRFFHRTQPEAEDELRMAIRTDTAACPDARAHAYELARGVVRRWLERWRRQQEPRAVSLYREIEQRFVDLFDDLRRRVATIPGLESLPAARPATGLRMASQVYYTDLMHLAPESPAIWLADRAAPWRRRRAIERAAVLYGRRLLEVNAARIKNDFIERVIESRRLLEWELRDALSDLNASIETALEHARKAHAHGADAVQTRLKQIETWLRAAEALRRQA